MNPAGDMGEDFTVTVSEGAPMVVKLNGELDMAAAPVLKQCLAGLAGDVVLDCTGLDFVDSSGLAELVRAHLERERRGERLSVRGLSPLVRRTFDLTGLDERLHLEDPPPA